MAVQPFTEAELLTLQNLLENGYSIASIALLMRRTRQTLAHYAALGHVRTPKPSYSAEEDATITRMMKKGAPLHEIGAAVGRSGENVRGRAQRLGLFGPSETMSLEKSLVLYAKAMKGKRFEDHPSALVSRRAPVYMPARTDGYHSEYGSSLEALA